VGKGSKLSISPFKDVHCFKLSEHVGGERRGDYSCGLESLSGGAWSVEWMAAVSGQSDDNISLKCPTY
jgi:hypothetical protein